MTNLINIWAGFSIIQSHDHSIELSKKVHSVSWSIDSCKMRDNFELWC
jgi:hypothetical protein